MVSPDARQRYSLDHRFSVDGQPAPAPAGPLASPRDLHAVPLVIPGSLPASSSSATTYYDLQGNPVKVTRFLLVVRPSKKAASLITHVYFRV